MNEEAQDAPETSSRGFNWNWIFWVGLLLVLYILSTGPFITMMDKKIIPANPYALKVLEIIYGPMEWVADNTVLEKPLGMYWHLWAPKRFDSKGNLKLN